MRGCTDLHFRGLSQQTHWPFVSLLSCTDLHFRGLSQHRPRGYYISIQLHGPPFQRPFTTYYCVGNISGVARTSISEAFHNKNPDEITTPLVARTSISEAFHNRKPVYPKSSKLHGPPFQRPFTTASAQASIPVRLHGPPFQRPFTTYTLHFP